MGKEELFQVFHIVSQAELDGLYKISNPSYKLNSCFVKDKIKV